MDELPEVTKEVWHDWYAKVFQNEPGELTFQRSRQGQWLAIVDIDVNGGEYHIYFEYDALTPGFPLYFWNENEPQQ